MEYYGIIPERKAWVKIAVILLLMYAIWNVYVNGDWLYVPFGVVLALAAFSSRKHIISEKGVDITYTVIGQSFHHLWTWSEILAVHTDRKRSAPNVEIHFSKGLLNRRFVISKSDTNAVVSLIGKVKSDISVKEVNRRK